MDRVDCLVIGAGVVGLAIARELALRGREVLVLEAEGAIGLHASSRNTGVIHAGLGYPPNSLKGRLCRRGRDLLYDFCRERGVAHRRIGKLIPVRPDADEEDIAELRAFMTKAKTNGCADLVWLERGDVMSLEPSLFAPAGVLSPSSGIIDQFELMNALWGELAAHGGQVVFHARVSGGSVSEPLQVETEGQQAARLMCRTIVNAAGVEAPAISTALGMKAGSTPIGLLQKGSYAVFKGRSPFSRLVYPRRHGLHASLDMAGVLRFGPDAEWVDRVDYRFDETRLASFYDRARQFWPDLPNDSLEAGWTAVRPKISRASAQDGDFVIQGPRDHGVNGLVNLFGIESPGLTACLAIAELVADLL